MSAFDPRKPPARADDDQAPRKLVTTGGVEVSVKAPPPAEPQRDSEPKDLGPRAVIFPEGQSEEVIRAFLDGLCKAHVKDVEKLLEGRRDVLAESRKDLRQRVLLVLMRHVKKEHEVPEDMQAFLGDVVRKLVRNHKVRGRLPVEDGADAESVADSDEDEPEDEVWHAEQLVMLERYLGDLPGLVAEVVRCVDQYGMTIEETAEVIGRAPSTVCRLLHRGRAKLRERARASERAPARLPAEATGARAKTR
jgi:RNA polymerase sigma factor (sigma-70 family)